MLIWEPAMNPVIKGLAQRKWGPEQWYEECLASVGPSMRQDMAAEDTWDLYRLAAIACEDSTAFFPTSNDKEMELHRWGGWAFPAPTQN